jgi:hypothetical protein
MEFGPYRLWYEFLKRSPKYRDCCDSGGEGELAGLYADFGDVHTLSWSKWWPLHKKLFSGVEPRFYAKVIPSIKHYAWTFADDQDDILGIYVNRHEPAKHVLKEVARILAADNKLKLELENLDLSKMAKRQQKRSIGRPKFEGFYHQYGLAGPMRLKEQNALMTVLKVYDACVHEDNKKKEGNKLYRYKIGESLKLKADIQRQSSKEVLDPTVLNNRMTATVSRYYRWGKDIIKNVENGVFPKHS